MMKRVLAILLIAVIAVSLAIPVIAAPGRGSGKTPIHFNVKFNSAGGSAVDEQRVGYGGYAKRAKDPVREGYTFAGWYYGGARYNFENRKVVRNITLKARWVKKRAAEPAPVDFSAYHAAVNDCMTCATPWTPTLPILRNRSRRPVIC